MVIPKKQKDKLRYKFNWSYFNSAREGFKHILLTRELKDKKILLPAYIGYSIREGSGVFDPIRETKKDYLFYNLDRRLNIDVEDAKEKIRENKNNILLVIHYFGFMDRNLGAIKQYARKYNMIIIEDFAQAIFTFLSNPVTDFDYAFFSIHKLFPVASGGIVIGKREIKSSIYDGTVKYNLFDYNIKEIAEKRKQNYDYILHRLKKIVSQHKIIIIRKELNGAVPQTFPILISSRKLRDRLYFQMNRQGYGVVSLYHTLINEIDDSFRMEHEISNRILNLPIHQDAEQENLCDMIDKLLAIMRDYNRK